MLNKAETFTTTHGYLHLYLSVCFHPSCPSAPTARLVQVLYLLLCIALLDYLHDTWFYWTHRLLHWRPIYKHVHRDHHRYVLGFEAGYLSGTPLP